MKFPGIGPRQARRFVYFILSRPGSFVNELISLIKEARESSRECQSCHRIFDVHSVAQEKLCSICTDTSRDHTLLMVVARDSDFESIEKSGAYKGLYFILGGTIPILDKEPERRVRMKALTDRVAAGMAGGANLAHDLKEIILSLSTTPEGENTADLVRHNIAGLQGFEATKIKISFLGRGLSTGAELEYADRETIKNAFFNRH